MTNNCTYAIVVRVTEEEGESMIRFIGARNEQAYYAEYLIKNYIKDIVPSDVQAYYPDRFLMKDIGDYITPGTSMIVIMGLPFKKAEQRAFNEAVAYSTNPEVSIYHFASWGDQLSEYDSFHSEVSETKSPIAMLHKALHTYEEMSDSPFVLELVELVDAYHRYDFNKLSASSVLLVKSLADVYQTDLAGKLGTKRYIDYQTMYDLLKDNEEVIQRETNNRNSYIESRANMATVKYTGSIAVIMVYAEHYTNELAMELYGIHEVEGLTGMVVLVGKHTRGDDMFSIRTAGEVSASDVAKALGNHKGGKEHVANVFLNRPLDTLADAVTQQLSTKLKP